MGQALGDICQLRRRYHSNDARDVVSDTGNKPVLPRALGGELGFRTKLFDRLDMAIDYWRLHLDSELVWAGDDGTTEPKGKTQRQGIEGEFRYQILEWLSADLDTSYTWAKFVKTGEAVPLAPVSWPTAESQGDIPQG